MELEIKLAQALEEVSHVGHLSAGGTKRANKDWLPTGHPKHALSGHHDKVNAVSFHPTYSIFASASADAAVKIWDWDSGELEWTLKGHTKSVTNCDFDSAGKHLGEFCFLNWLTQKTHVKTRSISDFLIRSFY